LYEYTFFYGKGNENYELCIGFILHKGIISAIKRVGFRYDKMMYIILLLSDHWCEIIVVNVHSPEKDRIDNVNHSFYEEFEGIFDRFPKYHMKILVGDFNTKVGIEKSGDSKEEFTQS
jgi:hypothetical protein